MPSTDWVRIEDGKGRQYYYNVRNSTSQWYAPPDFREPTPRTTKAVLAKGVVGPSQDASTSSASSSLASTVDIGTANTKRAFSRESSSRLESTSSAETATVSAAAEKPSSSFMGKAQSLLNKAKISSKLSLPTQLTRSTTPSPVPSPTVNGKKKELLREDEEEEEEVLEDRRCWGRPDRLRTESGEEAFMQQDPSLGFRTSSSADLIQLLKLTAVTTRNGNSQSASTTSKPLPRVDSYSLKRPPSFMETDFKNGKVAQHLVRPVKMNHRSRLGMVSSSTTAPMAGGEAMDDLAVVNKPPKMETRPRRNTTNSMQIDTLMSKPDCGVLIRCVASLLHAQMVRFALANAKPSNLKRFQVFNEDYSKEAAVAAVEQPAPLKRVPSSASNTANALERQLLTKKMSSHKLHVLSGSEQAKIPDKETLSSFIETIFTKAQMESETVVMLLIYVERLLAATGGKLELHLRNWKPIVMACMILASKVWDDLSMWNADFSLISHGAFTTKRINELEIALLEAMQYNVRVPASTYAKYYFQLRALRSTLGEMKRHTAEPLSVESAARLETLTDRYQDSLSVGWVGPSAEKKGPPRPKPKRDDKAAKQRPEGSGVRLRRNTLHSGANRAVIESMHAIGPRFMPDKLHSTSASLEQVVSLNHLGPQSDKF
ncbi:hypothetical protein BASA81_001881 [Batrachochytrium salamandrivorans]|nr:hypothetical protein BASA81_001881 [Batrachochytrium salamandrivorans]